MDIREFNCPNCGKTVKPANKTKNMKCPDCDAELEIKALADYQKEAESQDGDHFNWKAGPGGTWEESDRGNLSTGACPSCGAEIIMNKDIVTMICPCCGNAQIVQKQADGMLKPDYYIPFKLEKNSAVEALKQLCEGKRLLPDSFKKENRAESIQGMYVPFWLFDSKARARIRYKGTKVKSWSDGDYYYTKTDHYSVVRDGGLNFEKIPVDGSEKMNNAYMGAIKPFDYTQMKNFKSEYLVDYSAEKYDVDIEASKEKANASIKNSTEKEFANSVTGYSAVEMENSAVNIDSGKLSYTLLPVWILNTKYNDKNYQFIMNGQTGKCAGELPVDKGKAAKFRLLFTAIFGAVFTVIIQLLRVFI